MKSMAKASAGAVSTDQSNALSKLLTYASEYSPYYRELLGHPVDREWTEIPFLTKETIRRCAEGLKSTDFKLGKVRQNTSGGSTGAPVEFWQDAEQKNWGAAGKMLFDSWTGYSPGMPKFVLWGSERDIFKGCHGWRGTMSRLIRNQVWFNAFRMSEARMGEAVGEINRLRPVQILAYAESLYSLARFIEREKLEVHSPRAVMVSAGTLFPYMREVLERVFRAPVFNRYGSREAGDMACSYEGSEELYVNPATHFVEIIRPNGALAGSGEEGEIVVTVLRNRCMPLIRYRIGDIGCWAPEEFPRKLAWPCLLRVSGRVSDIFVNAAGDRIHGEYFTHLLYHRTWVKTFQIVQEAHEQLLVKIVKAHEPTSGTMEAFEAEFIEKSRKVMGEKCCVRFVYPTDIPPTSSGKFRYTLSKVAE
ncbi:MAG: phenylacetate--CoA ligase family protein [Opitutales bacterium]|nr:phenylacetate--CoA ligase family protein [Opitutales bacterium]